MSAQLLTVILVVIVALGFDFTNGFHDTGNSMATTIATGALKPRTAVALAAVLNLVGAFLSVAVALTVTNAVVSIQDSNGAPDPALTADHGSALLLIILAGLVGGIIWNLVTWLLGLPVELVARALRRPDRRDDRRHRLGWGPLDRRRHQAGRGRRQGDPAVAGLAGHRGDRVHGRHLADLPRDARAG